MTESKEKWRWLRFLHTKWGKRFTFLLAILFLFFGVRFLLQHDQEKEKTDFLILYDPNWGGANLDGQEKGFIGFSEDLLALIGKREKVSFRLAQSSSRDIADVLDSSSIDGVLTLQSPDHMLLDRYLFSDPYYQLGLVLVVGKGSAVNTLPEMEGKTVGIMRGSPALFYMPQLEKKGRFVSYDTALGALDDLVTDKIDGVLIGFISANTMEKGYFHGDIKIITSPLTQEGLRLVVKRTPSGQKLMAAFNRGLAEIEKEGIYDQLLDKWSLYRPLSFAKKEEAGK